MRWLFFISILTLVSCNDRFLAIVSKFPKAETAKPFNEKMELYAVVFLDIDCPISQYVIRPLNEVQSTHSNHVQVVGVIPGTFYSKQDVESFVKTYNIKFPILEDHKNQLVKHLNATVTPEVFLLDSTRNVLYQGVVDDKYKALGNASEMPGVYYLNAAISSYKAGESIAISKTKAIGCKIER